MTLTFNFCPGYISETIRYRKLILLGGIGVIFEGNMY